MASNGQEPDRSAHERSAETRRRRSRDALLAAGRDRFLAHGWTGTRMQDVAADAAVSTATAFNHFTTKGALIGSIFAPVFAPCLQRGAAQLAANADDPRAVLVTHLSDMTSLLRQEFALTQPFLEAVWDALVRFGVETFAADDPRMLVPLPAVLISIVERGQELGVFDPHLVAFDAAAFIVNSLALQIFCAPRADPEQIAAIVSRAALGVLDVQR